MKTALLLLVLSTTALAQPNTCGGLTSVTEGAKPVYPPIARAARVSGIIIMLISFSTTGEADGIQVVSGPPMLQKAATDYVRFWKANEYTGPRTCPIVIRYELSVASCDQSAPSPARAEPLDIQHVIIHGQAMALCDPSVTITRRRRRFLFF